MNRMAAAAERVRRSDPSSGPWRMGCKHARPIRPNTHVSVNSSFPASFAATAAGNRPESSASKHMSEIVSIRFCATRISTSPWCARERSEITPRNVTSLAARLCFASANGNPSSTCRVPSAYCAASHDDSGSTTTKSSKNLEHTTARRRRAIAHVASVTRLNCGTADLRPKLKPGKVKY